MPLTSSETFADTRRCTLTWLLVCVLWKLNMSVKLECGTCLSSGNEVKFHVYLVETLSRPNLRG